MLKKGPEIKLAELKVPRALRDLFRDLRDRHLLPLVGLLAIAIVAVPIALSQSSSTGSSGSAALGAGSGFATGSGSRPGTLIVAKAAPGLRSYRRRLAYLRAKDPFKQQYPAKEAGSGAESAAASSSGTATSGGESSISVNSASAPSSSIPSITTGPAASGGGEGAPVKYASYSIDVRTVAVNSGGTSSGASAPSPSVRRNLPELTMLPSREVPAAVFMGVSADGKKALMLVSSDVKSVFGDASCVVGSRVCQLLALEPELPETFVFGPQGRTYRIEILKIERTLTARPQKASLGAPKSGN